MSSAAWPYTRKPIRSELAVWLADRDFATIALSAGLCAAPVSIAASEALLAIALLARLAKLATRPLVFQLPRVFRFWLLWAGLETASWLRSASRAAGAGEMRHLLLVAALWILLPALDRSSDKVRVWKGIFAAATLGSAVLILEFFARLTRFRGELANGGDPAFYLRTGGLLHHWMVFGTVEIVVFAALLEFRAAYSEDRRWTLPALVVHTTAILLSLTRCLWLAAILVVGLHILRSRSHRAWALAPAFLILLAFGPVRQRVAQTLQPDYYSNAERFQMWRVGCQMIREHPLLGIGAGRIESEYARYLSPGERLPAFHGHLHNNALELGAEFGLLVLGAAALFAVILLRDLALASSQAGSCDSQFLCRSGLQGMAGFLAMGMMDYTYGHSVGLILLAFATLPPLLAARR